MTPEYLFVFQKRNVSEKGSEKDSDGCVGHQVKRIYCPITQST